MSQDPGGEIASKTTGNVLSGSGMQINAPIASINQYVNKDAESEEALCIRDLYITDPWHDKQRIEDVKGGLLRDSYSWILTQAAFSHWHSNPDARLLWVKGDPGTGKTMLLCGIVQELRHSMHRQDCLSFFFCEAGNGNADNAAAVLRGMIYLIINQHPTLIRSLIEKYKKIGSKLFHGLGAWYALREIFISFLPDLRREHGQGVTYFVIDAPDECGEDVGKLLSLVSEASSLPGIKWLVASRRRADVAKHLEVGKAGRQSLDLDDCTEELTHAVNAYIDRCASDLAIRTGNLRQQICQGLQDKAIITFQYVTLAVSKLKAASSSEVLGVLREYRQASDCIQHLERETRHLCCSVLATVAITHRPLNREELYALAGLPPNDVAEDIIRKCDSFGIRGLTTFSVNKLAREFLYGDSVLFPEGFENYHRRIFLQSLTIMEATLHRDIYTLRQPGILAVDIKTPEPDPLAVAGYASEYWIEHLVASNYHGRDTKDGGALSVFLEFKYLYWMESLSLLGVMRTALSSWTKLVNYLQGKDGAQQLAKLVVDAQRFFEYNGQSIMEHPLQAYTSATVFVPSGSIMRELVRAEEPNWVTVHGEMREEHWSPRAQTIDPGNAKLEVVGPVTFSPDGAWLAAVLEGNYDKKTVRQVQIWDIVTGNSVWTLEDASGWVAFSPKHTILGTVTSPGVVKFWDLTKGIWHHRVITLLNVSAAVFSPDGIWLAAADGDRIGIWNWARGHRALQFRHDSASPCCSVVYSAGGTHLASAHRDEIRVWNAQSGVLLRCINSKDTSSVAFLPDTADSRLISASNRTLITWSVKTGERLGMLDVPSEEDAYSAMALSADGSRFVVAPDGNIMVWDTTTRRRLQTIWGYDQHIKALIFSPDGSQIASISKWGLRLYRITSTDGEVFQAARDHPDKINLIRISADGNTMASASTSMMNIWDLTGACRRREINDTYNDILDMALSPDGTRLVSVSRGQDAAIWDVKTGNRLRIIPYCGFAVCFSPDGANIALLEPAGTIRVWSLVGQRCLQSFHQALRGEFGSGSVVFGPEDMILTSFDRSIRVWKLLRRRCNLEIDDKATATALVFSSDGHQFAASYTDKIKIWDSKSGCCLQTLDTGGSNITVVAFDAARSRLLTNVGLVLLDEVPAGHVDVRRELHRQGYGVNVTGDWVLWDSEKVLWLPPAYRPDSTAGILPGPEASTLSAIVLGCRSGRVVVLRFPDSSKSALPTAADPSEETDPSKAAVGDLSKKADSSTLADLSKSTDLSEAEDPSEAADLSKLIDLSEATLSKAADPSASIDLSKSTDLSTAADRSESTAADLSKPADLSKSVDQSKSAAALFKPTDPSKSADLSKAASPTSVVLKLSTLSQPSSPLTVPCFDIVLVHESGGHAVRTWQPLWDTAVGFTKLPDARVLTFGYSEISRHPYGRAELLDLGERLLSELSRERKAEDTRLRPLVFFGRGAGGFIIKQALVAARLDIRYRDMLSLTLGVVLFDTPHQSDLESWRKVISEMFEKNPLNLQLRRKAPADLLSDDDGSALTEISEAFVRIPSLVFISNTLGKTKGNAYEPTKTFIEAKDSDTLLKPSLLQKIIKLIKEKLPKEKKGALSKEYYRKLRLLKPLKTQRGQVPTPPTRGTCSWIETKPAFSEWRQWAQEKRLLWIRGEMGCGKTYLSRHVVQLVENPKSSDNWTEIVAYCCLQGLIKGYKTPQRVVGSLLYDILTACPEIASAMKLTSRLISDFNMPDVQKLWRSVITEAVTKNFRLTFIVDEIDQFGIDGGALDELIKMLVCNNLNLPNSGHNKVRLLVFSRFEEQLESTLGSCNFYRYDITPQDTQQDIMKTTEEVLDIIKICPGGSSIADEFRIQIEKGADGMYLWVQSVLAEAMKRMSPNNQDASHLPRGLFQLFDQYLGKFKSGDQDGSFQRKVLFWLTYQARHMGEEELQIAYDMVREVADLNHAYWADEISYNAESSFYHSNIKRDIMEKCSPLVKIDHNGQIGLVHRSLQEYLAMPKEEPPATPTFDYHRYYHCDAKIAHRNISSLCMHYLLQPAFKEPVLKEPALGILIAKGTLPNDREAWKNDIEKRTIDFPFLIYAASFWIFHARLSGPPIDVSVEPWNSPEALKLFGTAAISWTEVWYMTSGFPGKFPRSVADFRTIFHNEEKQIED